MLAKVTALLASAAVSACSVVGVRNTPEPHYQVVGHAGAAEVRRYGPRIVAETLVPGNELDARSAGFRRLAGYIFGGNRKRAEIAMTAPVAQRSGETIAMTAPVGQTRGDGNGWVIQFTMPANYTLATMPEPLDSSVHLAAVPGETVAVLRFSGSRTPDVVAARQRDLINDLQGTSWRRDGPAMAWFYDPPWTLPPFRRNEVAVPVVPAH